MEVVPMLRALRVLLVLLMPASSLAQSAPSLDALYERVSPAVVTITAGEKHIERTDRSFKLEAGYSTGAGVVLHADGFIATAAHVVETAEEISVEFQKGEVQKAVIVTLSRSEDIALLKVAKLPAGVKPVPLADSEKVRVGQQVFCIGTPLGLKNTLTAGIVSAIRDNVGPLKTAHQMIQTDAAMNMGNSGGALFDMKGEVVGVASFIASLSGGSMGLGFVVPSNLMRRRLFEQPLPYIGVSLRYIPDDVAELFNWPSEGLLVERVKEGSLADAAGLRGGTVEATLEGTKVMLGGDFIVKVGDIEASRLKDIHDLLRKLKEGEVIHYTVMRSGKLGNVDVTMGKPVEIPSLSPPAKMAPKK
jgi:serine protease Do